MQIRRQFILCCAFATFAMCADKNQFKPEALESYPKAQKVSGLTLAADSYHDGERAKLPFGKKAKPYENGILPVLLIIRNDSNRTVSLEGMRVEFQADRVRIEPTPPEDVPYARPMKQPSLNSGGPIPGKVSIRRGKNPLDAQQIQDRAFVARMLPPGEIAYGFLYFQTLYRENAILYITGIREPATGHELFFMEVPITEGTN